MPKQKRWAVKQDCEQANKHLGKAHECIVRSFYQYEKVHPEIYEKACLLVHFIEEVSKAIERLKDTI